MFVFSDKTTRCLNPGGHNLSVHRLENVTKEDNLFCILFHEPPVSVILRHAYWNAFCVNCNLKYPSRC